MSRWLNGVEAGMDAVFNDFLTVDLVLIFQMLVDVVTRCRQELVARRHQQNGQAPAKRSLGYHRVPQKQHKI